MRRSILPSVDHVPPARRPFPPFNAVLSAILLSILWSGAARAQGLEGDLTYKFSVEGVQVRAEAKPLVYTLMGRAPVHAIDFIEECACFKLASSIPLDHAALVAMLHQHGYRLTGPVEVSDGTRLLPQPITRQ